MQSLKNIILPDIQELAKKDSTLSTKRYAHLRLINHFVWQSWAAFGVLVYFHQWEGIKFHLAILAFIALGNGALALEIFKSKKSN